MITIIKFIYCYSEVIENIYDALTLDLISKQIDT